VLKIKWISVGLTLYLNGFEFWRRFIGTQCRWSFCQYDVWRCL